MVVSFIGQAGCGKTTLLKLVKKNLEKDQPQQKVICRSGLRKNLFVGLFAYVFFFSKYFSLAKKLGKSEYKRLKQPKSHFFWYKVLITERLCRAFKERRICLVDQGLINLLRKHTTSVPDNLLSEMPIPDVVINVESPIRVRQERMLTRNKPLPKGKKLTKEKRIQEAQKWAAKAANLLPKDCAIEKFMLWNQNNSNLLNENTLMSILDKEYSKKEGNTIGPPPNIETWEWLRTGLKKCDVTWIDVFNDQHTDINKTAQEVANEIKRARNQ